MSDDGSDVPDAGVTAGRGYELDEFVDVDSVARMKALSDPFRLYLTELVLERAMSVTELAERVGRPKGTVAYHVDQLVDAGLLKVVRTRQVRAVEERFYGRVARTMVFPEAAKGDALLPFLDHVVADFDRDLLDEISPVVGATAPHRPALSTYRRARIPAHRAAEYSRRFHDLAMEFVDEPRDGDVEFGVYVLMFPTRRTPNPISQEQTDD